MINPNAIPKRKDTLARLTRKYDNLLSEAYKVIHELGWLGVYGNQEASEILEKRHEQLRNLEFHSRILIKRKGELEHD